MANARVRYPPTGATFSENAPQDFGFFVAKHVSWRSPQIGVEWVTDLELASHNHVRPEWQAAGRDWCLLSSKIPRRIRGLNDMEATLEPSWRGAVQPGFDRSS